MPGLRDGPLRHQPWRVQVTQAIFCPRHPGVLEAFGVPPLRGGTRDEQMQRNDAATASLSEGACPLCPDARLDPRLPKFGLRCLCCDTQWLIDEHGFVRFDAGDLSGVSKRGR